MKSMILVAACAALLGMASADNLIKNGGFEGKEPLAQWTDISMKGSTVTISADHGAARSGSTSLKFDKTENKFFPIGRIVQSIEVPKGSQRLKVGLWAKASNAQKFTIKVTGKGAGGKPVSGEWGAYIGKTDKVAEPANHDWKQYWAVIEVNQDAITLDIELQMYGPGTVWVDDVLAEFVSADTPLKKAIDN